MWRLQTLGSLRLVDDAGREVFSGRRKELALLAFLAGRAPRFVPRAVLVELLWSDKDEERGRASLRQALSQLRRVLGDVLHARVGEDVALDRDAVELDTRRLDSYAAAGRWSDVIALWSGDFLAGADDLGGDACHEWLDGERARLSRIAGRAFASLIEDGERREAWTDVATLAQKWRDAFPDDTDAESALMRALQRVPANAAGSVAIAASTPKAPSARSYRSRLFSSIALAVVVVTVAAAVARGLRDGAAPALASGRNHDSQTLLVADFRAMGADTVIADVVAEMVRIGLHESRAIAVYPPITVQQELVRLGEPVTARATLNTARKIAARAGVKAVLDGEVLSTGSRYLLSARLVGTVSGEELGHYVAEASDRNELLSAVDRLVAEIRRGAGEPLRAVEAARPVERVTTSSLDALEKYIRGTRALDMEGAQMKGRALLEEAIALDSTFAMAHRRLGIELSERGGHEARVRDLMSRAYANRRRLADPERYAVEGAYYTYVVPDLDKTIAAYQAALEADQRYGVPLTNLAVIALQRRQWARAESLSQRLIDIQTATIQGHANLMEAQVNLGKFEAAGRTLAHFEAAIPGSAAVAQQRATLFYNRGMPDSASATLRSAIGAPAIDVARRQMMARMLSDLALVRGDVADARRWSSVRNEAAASSGAAAAPLSAALDEAWLLLRYDSDTARALQLADSAMRYYTLGSMPPLDRPYGKVVRVFGWAGRFDRARAALAGYDSAVAPGARLPARSQRHAYRGEVALAEHRYGDAVAEFRAADSLSCVVCMLPWIAMAYDGAGQRDSAAAILTRYVTTPAYDRLATDAIFLSAARQYLADAGATPGTRRR
ncbi:MAG TPA: winged helix-turn-helix domain-containing protein [Gemmatimonadaceae bacterium]|nr:winged helix-turn-helix domain-containing protein [Gemmatimonadaceae bacterium]